MRVWAIKTKEGEIKTYTICFGEDAAWRLVSKIIGYSPEELRGYGWKAIQCELTEIKE